MHKITIFFFLSHSLLYSQINIDYKEIAKQKIKAVYFGDTTLEDHEVFLYDKEGYFREKQIYEDYLLYESFKYEKDGMSWEELEMCCLKHTEKIYKCIKSDTCSYIKVEYDEKLRLVCKIQKNYNLNSWDSKRIGYEIDWYKCVDSNSKRFCSFNWTASGFGYSDYYDDSSSLAELKTKYYSIIEFDEQDNDVSCRTFMIYEGDTTPRNNSWNSEPANYLKFYAENGVLVAKEYFYFSNSQIKNCYREEYAYRKNGEIKKIVSYSKEIDSDNCMYVCDSLWYFSADEYRYNDLKNGGWISNNEIKCFPEYKKIKTFIPEYDDWLKWQKKTYFESLSGSYSIPQLKYAFKMDYWE